MREVVHELTEREVRLLMPDVQRRAELRRELQECEERLARMANLCWDGEADVNLDLENMTLYRTVPDEDGVAQPQA